MRGAAQLVAEVVPGVVAAMRQPAARVCDRLARVRPELRREQESDPGADGEAKGDARGEDDSAAASAGGWRNRAALAGPAGRSILGDRPAG